MTKVDELIEKGMPDSFRKRDKITVERLVRSMHENDRTISKVCRDLDTSQSSRRFRSVLRKAQEDGLLNSEQGHPRYSLTEKGRRLIDE